MARLPIGQRIRDARRESGISQLSLAKSVGISPSYLNLIEHDKRMIGGALLGRIAKALGVGIGHLSGTDDPVLVQQIMELVRSQALPGVEERDALKLVAERPEWARNVIHLHHKYQDAAETALALSDRLSQDPALMELSHAVLTQITSIRSFAEILEQVADLEPEERQHFSSIIASQSDRLGSSAREMINLLSGPANAPSFTSPEREVDDFIVWHRNHFPELEDEAYALHRKLSRKRNTLEGAIADALSRDHGIGVQRAAGADPGGKARKREKTLWLDETALETTARFQMARALVEIELADLIGEIANTQRLTSDDSRNRAMRALANYAAGALLFPYHQFLETAENQRYDIERLSLHFRGSFEQIAHRLVTLRRPGAEGVPFAFLRADPAGNLSKPFGTPGLPMPRFGGACPLWAIYIALTSRDRTISQLAVMPHGERFIFVARRLSKRAVGYGAPRTTYAVMLGCDANYADRVVYGDAYAPGRNSLETPVGFSCRSCPRESCAQRAQPRVRTMTSVADADQGARLIPADVE
jgi:predicted transcriptional regulator/transcriptional regulator with XRE-family HTH domain